MPNFEAKDKQEFQKLYPEYDAGPAPDREPLCKMADGTACNHYYMHSKFDTVEMVSMPGYFDFMRDTFRSGKQKGVVHLVSCFLGVIEEGLTQVELQLLDAPSASSGPVVMAVGRVTRFEPVKADKTKAA